MDGVDAALVVTDGERAVHRGPAVTVPYDKDLREALAGILGDTAPLDQVAEVARRLTDAHADAVRLLLAEAELGAADVAVIGFHGHTILHAPARGITRQIGDAHRLAAATGIDVVADFRAADVAAGGQGAPLVPAYHAALAADLETPVAVLNLGGVANVTWVGQDGRIMAFDTGPGNALLDDWAARQTGTPVDSDGSLATGGRVDTLALGQLLAHPYFRQPPPKSLDRNAFPSQALDHLNAADGAATLVAFSAEAVARAADHFPAPARRWLVAGGGRHNPALMQALADHLKVPVEPVETVGWDGDALEAEAFAYLAVRHLGGLPQTWPETTGAERPTAGGRLFRATEQAPAG